MRVIVASAIFFNTFISSWMPIFVIVGKVVKLYCRVVRIMEVGSGGNAKVMGVMVC